VAGLRRAYGEFYGSRVVPASTYGTDPVETLGVPNYLVVRAGMPAELVYHLTRLLLERRADLARAHPAADRLSPRSAINTAPLSLHPGAARYYRERKGA
jgi:hypothetical protein